MDDDESSSADECYVIDDEDESALAGGKRPLTATVAGGTDVAWPPDHSNPPFSPSHTFCSTPTRAPSPPADDNGLRGVIDLEAYQLPDEVFERVGELVFQAARARMDEYAARQSAAIFTYRAIMVLVDAELSYRDAVAVVEYAESMLVQPDTAT